jgi:hypothetical protein
MTAQSPKARDAARRANDRYSRLLRPETLTSLEFIALAEEDFQALRYQVDVAICTPNSLAK